MTLRQPRGDEREEKVLRLFYGRKQFKRAQLLSKTGFPPRTLDKKVRSLLADGELISCIKPGIGNRGEVKYYQIPPPPKFITRNDIVEEALGLAGIVGSDVARIRNELTPPCDAGECTAGLAYTKSSSSITTHIGLG